MSLTNSTIESLLVLCQKGNQLAQLEVYNRYQAAMYNVAFRIVKDTAEAEDVMQESFIKAFNKLNTLKDATTFGAWLKRIVVNHSIASYKKHKKIVSMTEPPKEDAFETPPENVDYSMVENPKLEKMLAGLEQLHNSYRQVLTLHYIEGYDYEELVEILDTSYSNCRTLVSRAKESLRKKLISKG